MLVSSANVSSDESMFFSKLFINLKNENKKQSIKELISTAPLIFCLQLCFKINTLADV